MDITYTSQYFPPEVCAPASRVHEFAREWADAGHQVTVLTGFPNHPEGVLHASYRSQWRRGLVRDDRDGIRVYRTWLLPAANRGVFSRIANYSTFSLSAAFTGPWIVRSDTVMIATSPQLLVGAAGYAISKLRRVPLVFEVRDLWPQSILAVGLTGETSLLYRGLDGLAKFLYRHADRIVLDGEWKRRELLAAGVPKEKTAVVRNGVVPDLFPEPGSPTENENRTRTRADEGLDGKFVVIYAGTLGVAHGLDTVLQAAERLGGDPRFEFILMGAGAEQDKLVKTIEERRLGNVRFVGRQPREKVPLWLAASDACVVPLVNTPVFKTAIPSKMFEAMAAGRPIVLGVEGEAREILLDAEAGVAIPPEDAAAMVAAFQQLADNPAAARQMGQNGRRAAITRYSRREQAARYVDILEDVREQFYGRPARAKAASARSTP